MFRPDGATSTNLPRWSGNWKMGTPGAAAVPSVTAFAVKEANDKNSATDTQERFTAKTSTVASTNDSGAGNPPPKEAA